MLTRDKLANAGLGIGCTPAPKCWRCGKLGSTAFGRADRRSDLDIGVLAQADG